MPQQFVTSKARRALRAKAEKGVCDDNEQPAKDDEARRLKVEDGRVPTSEFVKWLHDVLRNDTRRDKQALEEAERVAEDAGSQIDVEAFIRGGERDVLSRFDVGFCRRQYRAARDAVGLALYFPLLCLLTFFLIEGKGLYEGAGYWLTANVEGFFLEQEFENSADLRFVKTYADVGSDGEFWEFATGPLLGGLWPTAQAPATELIQQSLMPIGAMKVRQIRVEGHSCSRKLSRMFSRSVNSLVQEEGSAYVISRMQDFTPKCYADLNWWNTNVDRNPYPVVRRLHDGIGSFSMNDTRNPSGWSVNGSLRGSTDVPPMFFEEILMTDDMVVESDRFMLDAFKFHTCEEFNGSSKAAVQANYGRYSCEGHGTVIPFSWTQEKAAQAIGILQNGITVEYADPQTGQLVRKQVPWLDVQTRSLSFEIVFYSKDVNLFLYANLLVERTAAGAYIPGQSLNVFQLFDHEAHSGVYYAAAAFYAFFTAGFGIHWGWSLLRRLTSYRTYLVSLSGRAYFMTIFDGIIVGLFVIGWGFRITLWHIGLTDESILQTEYYPGGYEQVAQLVQLESLITASNGFLAFLRIFAMLRVFPRLNVLTQTITEAAFNLFMLLVIFLAIFLNFTLTMFVIYGRTVFEFRSWFQSGVSLARVLFGDFDFETLMAEQRLLTPIIFTLYAAITVFLLLNMVIAVLDLAYGKVTDRQYDPDALISIMNNSDVPELEVSGERNERRVKLGLLLNNPITKEIEYWLTLAYLSVLKMTNHAGPEVEARWREAEFNNPRVYWERRLREMVKELKTLPFVDRCRIFDRKLSVILRDKFGEDFKCLVDKIVFQPARAMKRQPRELLMDLLSFHHVWREEVSEKTQTGETVKRLKKQREEESDKKLQQEFLREQERFKEESRNDTKRRLRQKLGREPTVDEIINEMTSAPPEDQQNVEKSWLYQQRRLQRIAETFAKLTETRERNISDGGTKMKFTDWMVAQVAQSIETQLQESLGSLIQEEIQREMAHGDITMETVLRQWRDGVYADRQAQARKREIEMSESFMSESFAAASFHEDFVEMPPQLRRGAPDADA